MYQKLVRLGEKSMKHLQKLLDFMSYTNRKNKQTTRLIEKRKTIFL